MHYTEVKNRLDAAQKILVQGTTTWEKFESVQKLLVGINPRLDQVLQNCGKALTKLGKLEKGQVIDLAIEDLPEDTEENKKRKKTLLFFVRSWRELKGEVSRIKKELESSKDGKSKTTREQVESFGRILSLAKGPLGIITGVAALLVIGAIFIKTQKQPPFPNVPVVTTTAVGKKIQVITFNGEKIPLSQLHIGTGSDCDGLHYHALNGVSVKALDRTVVADPGGCGYGKVKDVLVEYVEAP